MWLINVINGKLNEVMIFIFFGVIQIKLSKIIVFIPNLVLK